MTTSPYHPHPQRVPDSLSAGRPTITQRVLSINLTSSKWRAGIGVFSVVTRDENGSHTLEFKEFDVLLRQAVEALQPMERGKAYKVNFDITWRHEDGWPTVKSYKENEMQPDTSILDEALGRAKDEQADRVPTPPEKRPKVANGAAPFIRNHFKLHYNVEGQALNELLTTVYMGMSPEKYISGNGVEAAYRVMDTYDAGQKSDQPQNSPNEAASATEAKTEPTPQEKPPTHIPDEKPTVNPTLETVTGEILPDEHPADIGEPSKEIILFDPRRAISRAEAAKAVVDRMFSGGVLVKDVDYGPVPGTDKPTLLKPGAEKLLTAFHLFDQFKPTEIVRDWKTGFFFYEYECTLYDRETGKAIGSGIGSCNSMEKKYRYRWVTEERIPRHLNKADLPVKGGRVSEPEFAIDKAETTGKYGKPAAYWQQFKDAIAAGNATAGSRETKNGKPMKTWEIDTTMYGIPNEDIFDQVNTISKMAQKRALVAAALNATGASAVFTQDMEDFADFGVFEAA